ATARRLPRPGRLAVTRNIQITLRIRNIPRIPSSRTSRNGSNLRSPPKPPRRKRDWCRRPTRKPSRSLNATPTGKQKGRKSTPSRTDAGEPQRLRDHGGSVRVNLGPIGWTWLVILFIQGKVVWLFNLYIAPRKESRADASSRRFFAWRWPWPRC